MTSHMDFTAGLNPQQQQAVIAGPGPVLVLAGPGSGKTRVLTHRIAYLISALGVRPRHILAVTFTNKAAREMESRVVHLIGQGAQGMTLGTFHASCARILRREAKNLPFESNFVIFDADDQVGLVKRIIRDLDLDEKRYRAPGIHASISNAKNDLLLPDEFPINTFRDEVVQRVYLSYQKLLLASNALDFDDLLLWTAFLFEEFPKARTKYARFYEHILVDEFQDTNFAQYVLLKHLVTFHHNIFVVGDTDQSIYRWRGADYRNVLRFEKDFPDSQVILLEQNYRSTQAILDVAMAIINRHPYRTPKLLFTSRGQGQKMVLHVVYDDREEAVFVITTILNLVARRSAKPGDFAVMYRTNAQSRLLEEAFLRAELPYKLVGAQRFYGRREVKDVIAYLRLVHNPYDEISLIRIINVPRRGIGDKSSIALRTQAQANAVSPGNLLLELGRNLSAPNQEWISRRAGAALRNFGGLLAKWSDQKPKLTPLALMDLILEDVDYRSYIDDGTDEGSDRWENLMELRRLAAEFHKKGLTAFLEQVALVSDQDTLTGTINVPTLLTLHAAKGLEFPIVLIVGLNDGTLPHSRSFDDPEEMMEERRLFYVGITRAMDRLYLVCAQNRSIYGYPEPVDASRFLDDIPRDLIEDAGFSHSTQRTRRTPLHRSTRWSAAINNTPDTKSAYQQKFHPGMQVQHPTWGDGMVLNSRIDDGDEVVDIFFEELGLKRVAASLAHLEILP
ncbi:ATP-dependent helicase [Chloroflexota bacterium]